MVLTGKFKLFLETIKFEHTLFALPFAYLGLLLGERGLPSLEKFLWVTGAMVGIRTVGMIANRLADLELDRENPRTQNWPLSKGLISKNFLIAISIPALLLYFASARALNPLCFLLAPIPCAMIFAYPHLKRYTWFCHIFLGAILASAPLGGWMASRGVIGFEPVPLALSVLFWVAGFDILYALQDEAFDRKKGLFSIPASFGKRTSLWLAFIFHGIAIASLIWLGRAGDMRIYFWIGVALASVTILPEHIRGPRIFFLPNASFSVIIFLGTFLDLVLR